jgi:hypothetical protein
MDAFLHRFPPLSAFSRLKGYTARSPIVKKTRSLRQEIVSRRTVKVA